MRAAGGQWLLFNFVTFCQRGLEICLESRDRMIGGQNSVQYIKVQYLSGSCLHYYNIIKRYKLSFSGIQLHVLARGGRAVCWLYLATATIKGPSTNQMRLMYSINQSICVLSQ